MLYDTLVDETFEDVVDGIELDDTGETAAVDFVRLLEIGEADEFSQAVARLEAADIPWYVESEGAVAVLYVTHPQVDRARQLLD